MPAIARSDDRLSAEARGKARLLIQRLTGGTPVAQINRLRRAVIANIKRRGSPPRPETLDELTRTWRALPGDGQINLTITRGKHSFIVADTRMFAEKLGNQMWDQGDSEPALMIGVFSLEISRTRAEMQTVVLASAGIHAIGRRLSRPAQITDASVLADIRTLEAATPAIIARGPADFSVPLPEGRFVGTVAGFIDTTGERHDAVCHVRTFYGD